MGRVTTSRRLSVRRRNRPAGFTAGELAAGLLRAYLVFLVLAPAALVLWAHPWMGASRGEFWAGLGFSIEVWFGFAVASGVVIATVGWPIALGVAALLRPARRPAVHLAVHGTAAVLVCLAIGAGPSLAGGSDLSATLGMVLGIYWPVISVCVISTWAGWLLTARAIRRADAKHSAAPRPPSFAQPRSVSTVSSELGADAVDAGAASDRGRA